MTPVPHARPAPQRPNHSEPTPQPASPPCVMPSRPQVPNMPDHSRSDNVLHPSQGVCTTGEHALILPGNGYVQPPSGAGHAENPQTKRRLYNPVECGLLTRINPPDTDPVTDADILRFHTPDCLHRFKTRTTAPAAIRRVAFDRTPFDLTRQASFRLRPRPPWHRQTFGSPRP